MTARLPRTIADLDVSQSVLEASLRAGRLAEYGRLLHDADPDSTVPAFPDLAKGRVVDLDFARSVRDGFEPAIDWTVDPPESTRHTPAPDCEPEFVARPVADVQTGGEL